MEQPIIAVDLGNWYSFLCCQVGGRMLDLLPGDMRYGYPSVFFYSKRAADKARSRGQTPPPWCGAEAVKAKAVPQGNRVRGLKQHLGEALELDDWKGSYDEAITALLQYLMRRANEVLQTEALQTTPRLALAHPATYTVPQMLHIKALAEKATLEDGRHVQVVGMIAEPAAGALDFLVNSPIKREETTVLTYDLGAGTFDLAIVTAYPEGRKSASGSTYYYDIERTGGLPDVGGARFDEALAGVLRQKLPGGARVDEDTLLRRAEEAKLELTDEEETEVEVADAGGVLHSVTVTRQEFERAARPLLERTLDSVRKMLADYKGKRPEMLVLTGGSSQMPMVREALLKAFPEFEGKVQLYRPSRAIAYGAARFATPPTQERDVMQRAPRDIGIRFYYLDSDRQYVDTYIPAGTPLPFSGGFERSSTRREGQRRSVFTVMEAAVAHPDKHEWERDYREIMTVELDYGRDVPKGTPAETRLVLDSDGLLSVEARDPGRPEKPPMRCTCRLGDLKPARE